MTIIEAVSEVANEFKPAIKAGRLAALRAVIQPYADAVAVKPELSPWEWAYEGKPRLTMGRADYRAREARYHVVREYVESYTTTKWGLTSHYRMRPEWEAMADRAAQRYVDDVVSKFVAKMANKLRGMVDGRGAEVSVSGTLGFNAIHVKYADGAEFHVRNQIVSVWPQNAAAHHRYPTTFHNVKTTGGATMPGPLSEAKVKTALA